MKYQTKEEAKKALVVRLPAGVKARLDSASQSQGISQSRLASELISEGLNQSVSLETILDDVGVVIEDDDKVGRDRLAETDMTTTYIWLPGQPIGKGRPRFTRTGRVYTPEKTRKFEHRLAAAASDYMALHNLEPTEKPCQMVIKAQFEIPKSWTKARKAGGCG